MHFLYLGDLVTCWFSLPLFIAGLSSIFGDGSPARHYLDRSATQIASLSIIHATLISCQLDRFHMAFS